MTDNNIKVLPAKSVGKLQSIIDLQMKRMMETFILNTLRNWRANRSHPIERKYLTQKSGKVFWNSKIMGTYVKSIHGNMNEKELANLRLLRERKEDE